MKCFEFALQIFPLVLHDILRNDDLLEGSDARRLGDSINRLMATNNNNNDTNQNNKHEVIILNALQFIHEQQMVVKRQPVRNETRKKTTPLVSTMEHINA